MQLENGYLAIALSLHEALLRAPLPGRHQRVFGAMIRLLYGWKKTEDRIASSQVAALTGIHDRDVRAILDDLVELHMLECEKQVGRTTLWRIQKDFDLWLTPRVRTPGSTHAPARTYPGVSTRETPRVDTPRTPRVHTRHQRKKANPKATPAGQAAVAAFCEAFKRHRQATYAVEGKDASFLKQRGEQIGLEAFVALLEVFFGLSDDRWVAAQGWNVNALRQRWQSCHARVQRDASYHALKARLAAEPEPTPEQLKEARI